MKPAPDPIVAQLLLGLGALALVACALLPAEAPKVDPCSAAIVRLEGQRTAEIALACQGQAFDECAAVAKINAKYDPLIAEQVECKP